MSTKWLERGTGRIAWSEEGEGPLVVCVPGLGDLRQEYRFLAPALAAGGFRVASMDLRGHGESSTGWADLSAEAIGGDVLALVRSAGAAPAALIGTSMAAGAVAWAAAQEPDSVSALALIGPFVRDVGSAAQMRLYRALFAVVLARPWGLAFWMRYWTSLFPTRKPPDFEAYRAQLRRNLSDPERFAAVRAMMLGPSRRAVEAALSRVHAPALVMMGTMDRDFPDPAAEARLVGERLRARVEMIDGAGHYPHVEFPERTSVVVSAFIRDAVAARAAASGGAHEHTSPI